jgi:cytosine/adenosine deaminase-related metal-dependent hydrolase
VVGSIEEGKRADFLIVAPGYESKRVFLAGKEI